MTESRQHLLLEAPMKASQDDIAGALSEHAEYAIREALAIPENDPIDEHVRKVTVGLNSEFADQVEQYLDDFDIEVDVHPAPVHLDFDNYGEAAKWRNELLMAGKPTKPDFDTADLAVVISDGSRKTQLFLEDIVFAGKAPIHIEPLNYLAHGTREGRA